MIGLLLFGFGFVLGMLTGQGKLTPWVRAAAGKARDFVAGNGRKAPARAAVITANPAAVEPETQSREPIDWPKLAGEIWKFIWFWRYWIMAGLIAWFAWGLLRPVVSFVTCPFGLGPFCASKSDDDARVNTQVAQHETGVANRATELSGETNANVNAARGAARIAQEDIENAVATLPRSPAASDFAELQRRYSSGYERVLGVERSSDQPNPNPSGIAPMRGPRPDAA